MKTELHFNGTVYFHRDPDSVVLCVLATDEEEENDVALQIHFTLIQAFCCDIDINIVRVSGMGRLAQVLGEPHSTDTNANEPRDLHCILVTVSVFTQCKCASTRTYKSSSDMQKICNAHGVFLLHLEPSSRASEAERGRELLQGEPLQEPVGALHRPAGALSHRASRKV